jgi:hypothetical protein
MTPLVTNFLKKNDPIDNFKVLVSLTFVSIINFTKNHHLNQEKWQGMVKMEEGM